MVRHRQDGLMKKVAAVSFLSALLYSHGVAQSNQDDPSLTSLVASERAFSRTSVERGIRASFLMFFADDAIVFRPHPVKYKEVMKKVPAPKNPLEVSLMWEPLWADVSRGGDFGYTTGPSVWTDHTSAKRPTYYGFYFSFWKKQPTGEWKVIFDVGTELPGPYDGPKTLQSPATVKQNGIVKKLGAEEQRSSLMDAERRFLKSARKNGVQKSLGEILDKEARIYRQKAQPIVGIDSIQGYFSKNPYLSMWEPFEGGVAESGDMGYTYGSYTVGNESKPGNDENGYYLHAWRRDASNRWTLVAEVTSPLPSDTPKTKR
jgi:ketosteroid isomerase-like protein